MCAHGCGKSGEIGLMMGRAEVSVWFLHER